MFWLRRKEDTPPSLYKPPEVAFYATPGRKYTPPSGEDPREIRDAFKHDEDEIIYSKAFRRLAHKSQVVVKPDSDHFRSRLTHTLEVKQIAESIALRLKLHPDLVDAIALGHDLGHAPFGHAGERKLQDLLLQRFRDQKLLKNGKIDELAKQPYRLFHHAINSISIIERKLSGITDDTISGIRTHSWSPWSTDWKFGFPHCYEAQVVALADQIAGINHDTEDILSCAESGITLIDMKDAILAYISKVTGLDRKYVRTIRDDGFFRDAKPSNGYGRKYRLQYILYDLLNETTKKFEAMGISSKDDGLVPEKAICLSDNLTNFIKGFEDYLRKEIIKKQFWFINRDRIAGGHLEIIFVFLEHYYFGGGDGSKLSGLSKQFFLEFKKSVEEDLYNSDTRLKETVAHASSSENEIKLEHYYHIADYISGMTDYRISDIYNILGI